MSVLEDPARIAAGDPGRMLALAAGLGGQLRDGFEAARSAGGLPSGDGVTSVVMCGMGGSGIAGDVTRALLAERMTVPVIVTKGYRLPEFCGRDTLVVAMSFSGNTEETLSAYGEAVARGCRLVAVSAGGELEARSRADGAAHVPLPPEIPMPRAALGYLAAAPLGVLEAVELVPALGLDVTAAAWALDGLAERLAPDRAVADNEAKSLADWIGERIPVVWGSEGVAETAALRWKSQMNENAKTPALHSVLPELDHNEVEGWSTGSGRGFALLVLRHAGEHPRVGARVEATLAVIDGAGLEAREVWADAAADPAPAPAPGMSTLFALVMMGDFASIYLGIVRGYDPGPIPVLSDLKERLRR